MSKENFSDNTYSLGKGLNHIKCAREYFEDLRLSTNGSVKNIFNNFIMRCDYMINNISDRLTEESREMLKTELKDTLVFDSISDKLIHLTNEQRLFIEDILDSMIKGEEVKILD
jgi:curli biogenesis system outer membrane secretion channel CsgG